MIHAKFISNNDNDNCKCNICSDIIENDKIIALGCDPSKHIFCYDCILDWYKELKINKKSEYNCISTMCPICRKNGGLLPMHDNYPFMQGIHLYNNLNHLNGICGAKFSTKTGYCKKIGKPCYGGFCVTHIKCKPEDKYVDMMTSVSSVASIASVASVASIDTTISQTSLFFTASNICGFKYKTKNGYCGYAGKTKYGGLCGLHSKCTNII